MYSHPDPPSHLPLHLIPLGLPSAPATLNSILEGPLRLRRYNGLETDGSSIESLLCAHGQSLG